MLWEGASQGGVLKYYECRNQNFLYGYFWILNADIKAFLTKNWRLRVAQTCHKIVDFDVTFCFEDDHISIKVG